jgi:hypothetical protein
MRSDNQEMPAVRFKKQRIAISAASGIACVLLHALWARSYWRVDIIDAHNEHVQAEWGSVRGEMAVGVEPYVAPFHGPRPMWQYESYAPNYKEKFPESSILGFGLVHIQNERGIWFPHWALLLAMATVAASPWIRWAKRFCLRTLLIATTLIALLLGLIVYASS